MSEGPKLYDTSPPQCIVDDMITGPTKFLRFKQIALRLDTHRYRGCRSCTHHKDDSQNSDTSYTEDLRSLHPPKNTADIPLRSGHSLTNDALPMDHNSDSIVEAIPLCEAGPDDQMPPHHTSDDDFNDYDSAPILRKQQDILVNTWSFDGYGNFILESCWGTWIDYGYRLIPRFFSMFPHNPPAQHLEHLLPTEGSIQTHQFSDTEPSESLSSSWATNSVGSSSLDDDDPGIAAIKPPTPDPPELTLGLQGMLDEAGLLEDTMDSQNIFVCGKGRTGELFRVDPTIDEIKIAPNAISTSYDLDSLIYATYRLKFRAPIHLHLNPLLGSRAPFWKNNQIHVNILSPPTDVGSRSRTTKTFTLNQIPHTHFGQLGIGAVLFNIYIFFPRMIHKHPKHKFMLNMIPLPVQELWFSSAIIPAAREVFANSFPGTTEYLPGSLEELQLKKGVHGPKTIVTSPACLDMLQDTLRSRILNNPDLLQRFGSCFFVVDSRGIKLLSKQYELQTQPQGTIQKMLPFLDLEHMMDREHGELVLDLGISYHPPTNQGPRIGLWKLAKVNNSYGIMGTTKGRQHHTCTLDGYGGRQAPLGKARKLHTQLLLRSTYNLVFEVVRVGSQTQYLCTDADAVMAGDRYMKACQSWKDLFHKAISQSFGVREEVRGSAAAIFYLFHQSSAKVTSSSTAMDMPLNLLHRPTITCDRILYFGFHPIYTFPGFPDVFQNSKTFSRNYLPFGLTITG
jgi:hypothetical protein